MNKFFPGVNPPRRRGEAFTRLQSVIRRREAIVAAKATADREVTRTLAYVFGVLGFLTGVTLVWFVLGPLSLGALWVAAASFTLLSLIRLPFIRRAYLLEVQRLQDPTLPSDARPEETDGRTPGHTENGE